MKKFLSLAVLALCLSMASAALEPSPPAECPFFLMTDVGLTAIEHFSPNLLLYNANDLMSGSPRGPWFGLDEGNDCYFNINATAGNSMRCNISLYLDSSRSIRIGSGHLRGDNLQVASTSNGFRFVGGHIFLSTSIVNPPVSLPSPITNFLSQSNVDIYFEPRQVVPPAGQPGVAVANGLRYSNASLAELTMWGSNGWNAATSQFDLPRTTGMDFQAKLYCAPFVPPPTTGRPTDPVCV